MKAIFALLLSAGAVPAAGQTFAAESSPPERMVFVLEESENARGTRATLTLTRIDANTFEEVFDLTLPGASESITIRGRWTRDSR